MISTVNLSEVYARVVSAGQPVPAVVSRLLALGLRAKPFTEADARVAADYMPVTRAAGLSLGDRACLSLDRRLGLPVLTADRAWKTLALDVEVRLIR